jgi:uncharacterized protein YqhQ
VRLITSPNLALQKLTTRWPDDDQIEVAIAAMQSAIDSDQSDQTNDFPSPVQEEDQSQTL